MAAVQYYGTGRRKTSTARVFLRPGTGAISINSREFDAFFPTEALRTQIRRPLVLTETADKFDILATVEGGGIYGQVEISDAQVNNGTAGDGGGIYALGVSSLTRVQVFANLATGAGGTAPGGLAQ